MERPQIEIRAGEAGDVEFVYSTWLRNYKGSSYFAKRIPRPVFFKHHHRLIEQLLARGARVQVAHPVGDPQTILGYIVTEETPGTPDRDVLHFVYVKRPFRGLGIGRALFDAAALRPDFEFSHWTFATDALIARWPHAVYCPYLAAPQGEASNG